MEKLSQEILTKEYLTYKKKANDAYNSRKFEDSLSYIEYCARLAQAYPIIYEFVDEELEQLLNDISIKIQNIPKNEVNYDKVKSTRIVFYNGQIVNSGGITEQYLDFFITNKIETLIVIPDIKNTIQGKRILETIEKSDNLKLFIPESGNKVSRIKKIKTELEKFNPSHAFLHFLPSDVIGYCVFSQLKSVKRFYIVHNDHTFWLGKNCSDFFIEFRQFGHQIAVQRRGINTENILLVPYYPIKNNVAFQGFPFDTKGKIVGFSGANLYKYLLDPELKYFHAIKQLINQNPDFVFCLAGYGDNKVIENFITENHLQNRFFFLGRRSDYYNLIDNVDIYFESYPMKGGLSVLYATEQNIPITGIANLQTSTRSTSSFFDAKISYDEPHDFESFIKDANGLITSVFKREERKALFNNLPNNKTEFQHRLTEIMNNNFQWLRRIYDSPLIYDDNIALKEYISLPKVELYFLIRKFQILKKCLSFSERLTLIFNILLHDDFKLPVRLKFLNCFLDIFKKIVSK